MWGAAASQAAALTLGACGGVRKAKLRTGSTKLRTGCTKSGTDTKLSVGNVTCLTRQHALTFVPPWWLWADPTNVTCLYT